MGPVHTDHAGRVPGPGDQRSSGGGAAGQHQRGDLAAAQRAQRPGDAEQGRDEPAGRLTQPPQEAPDTPNLSRSATATMATGNAAAHAPNRLTSHMAAGVSAVSTAYTPRNHSGLITRKSSVCTVTAGTPARHMPSVTGTQTAARAATGRAS